MSRYFALPVFSIVVALVGVRMTADPASRSGPLAAAPQESQQPSPADGVILTAAELWETAPVAVPPAAPRTEPAVIVLQPASTPAPLVRTEVVERTVYVPAPQITIAPIILQQPVVEIAPEVRPETAEVPVAVYPFPAVIQTRRLVPQKESFFKTVPFLPPTPQHARWNP
jgi:hypothetical protein